MKKNKGFTMVEILIGMAIFIPLVLMTYQMMNRGLDFWEIVTVQGDLQASGHRSINEISSELRNATRTAGATPPDVRIIAANRRLQFYLPADISGNGLITDNIGNTEWDTANIIEYRFDNVANQLLRIEGGTQVLLCNNVANATFDDLTTDITLNIDEVRITLLLQKTTAKQRTLSESFTALVRLRN